MARIPEQLTLDGLEAKWDARWEADGTFRFDRSRTREQIYSIDTPPPTVSGSLHMGSVFGYVQTDAIARFRRMQGREVFYPMGWDDNGLPTERRVQNYYDVRCDPAMPYDPAFTPPEQGKGRGQAISRRNFVDLCHRLTSEDEKVFEDLWRTLGLSVDWTLTYATIDDHSRRVSQRAFLRNLARGEAYASEAPTLWDVDFQTAVAQAELEDRETDGAYHRIGFLRPGDDPVYIETTRPELLPSCVALVAHPTDARYQPLFGTTVLTPLFGVAVPVVPHELADPEKGSGIAMICTFGDTTDVVWWRELGLPTRTVIQRDGRFQQATPAWLSNGGAERWAELAGRTIRQAQRRVVEMLVESGDLVGDPRPIRHAVRFFEKGDRPLEVVASRQWYIRNGGRDPALRQALLQRGRDLAWHPETMQVRYERWVEGLNGDWLISRQRFFGIPFPVWYRLDGAGEPQWEDPILAAESSLPVDPQSDPAPGFAEDQRGVPGGFIGDPDVMDTWATSSLTPQIATGWGDDEDLWARTFPMDLRPQGPEIIRTWLFATAVRSHFEHGSLPWANAAINGWVLDPDRKKMSKSRGNVVTPRDLITEFGADGIRYWACRGAPGTDTAADKGVMKVGRRLAIKLLNATRFVLGLGSGVDAAAAGDAPVTELVDMSMLGQLASVVAEATAAFDGYEYHRALEHAEVFFWKFCDDYVELVKTRAYGTDAPSASARAALALALSTLHRLFAPFLPFVAEEVWSWWQEGSVHTAPWPTEDLLRAAAGDAPPVILDVAAEVLAAVRKAKTSASRSLRTEVATLTVAGSVQRISAARAAEPDLREAGRIREFTLSEGEPAISVVLQEDAPEGLAPAVG